jgi:hypothetical protein
MTSPYGGESSEEEMAMEKAELTELEQELLERFGIQHDTACSMIDDWIDRCEDYENQTRDDLFGNYKVLEDYVLKILKDNKVEMKNQFEYVIRMLISQRRSSIKELWHKERLRYMRLDLLLQIKADEASFKKGMGKKTELQKTVHEDKAGEMSIDTNIERSPATTEDIRLIKKPIWTMVKEGADGQGNALQSGTVREFPGIAAEANGSQDTSVDIMAGEVEIAGGSSMDSADLVALDVGIAGLSSLESVEATDVWKDDTRFDEEEGWSSGCEELEVEWVHFGEKVSTGSAVPTGTIFAYCIGCKDPSHRVNQCQDFINMPVIQRHGIVRKLGACRRCLKGKHFARDCDEMCGDCERCDDPTHHTLLHYDYPKMMGKEIGAPKDCSTQFEQSGGQAMPSQIQMQTSIRLQARSSITGQWAKSGNGTAKRYMERASRRFIKTVLGEPTFNNEIMVARLDHLKDSTDSTDAKESMRATIGQDINSKIKSKTLNTSNKIEARQQLPGSSKMNSTTDDNKTTNTYVRLITFSLVQYVDELVRINGIIDEGSTDLFITRAVVRSKSVEVKMTSRDEEEIHDLEGQRMEEMGLSNVVLDMKELIRQYPWRKKFQFHKFKERPVQMLIGLKGLCLIKVLFEMDQETTGLRICFDLSWKYGHQRKSLKEAELAGPKLQNTILKILLLFRLNPFAITDDVWHRIHIGEENYQFNDWPFGSVAGPFAALFTRAKLAKNLGKVLLTTWIMENCFYMDDILASVQTRDQALAGYKELIEVYDQALLSFRKWCTNDPEILKHILENHRSKGCDFNDESLDVSTLDGSQRLFVFGDGSRLAYAVVAYIRVVYEDRVEVKLICAKKKNVPLKGRTIPQIELLAATIASRLGRYLKTVFIEVEDVHYWNEWQCVLKWIQNHERRYITFVRSRITEIHDTTGGNLWRHCQTGDNPADSPTRGLTVNQLKPATWWNGPHWLSDEEAIAKLSFTPEVCPIPAKRIVDSTTLQVCVDNIESLILGEEEEKPVWAEDQKSMCHKVMNGKHTLKLDVSKKWIVVVDHTKMERKQLSTRVKNKMALQSLDRRWKAVKLIVNRQQHDHYSDEKIKAFKMGSWVGSRLMNVCSALDPEVLFCEA